MKWAAFILGLVGFLTRLISWALKRRYINDGEQKAIADALRIQAEQIEQARLARARAAADAQRVRPDGALPDDSFRRD